MGTERMLVQVEKTDDGFLIPIPDDIAEKFGVGAGDVVDVVWENGRFVVSRIDKLPDDIGAMVLTITPENRQTEIRTGSPRGNEVW